MVKIVIDIIAIAVDETQGIPDKVNNQEYVRVVEMVKQV